MPSPEADPTPGRRWKSWDIAPIHGVDTAGIGFLRVGHGDSCPATNGAGRAVRETVGVGRFDASRARVAAAPWCSLPALHRCHRDRPRPAAQIGFPLNAAPRTPRPGPTGMKPIADGIRRVSPFRSPKREGQHEQTRRNTGGDARSQLYPPHGRTGARAHRQGRWRDQSPLRLRGYMDGPASLATIPPLVALREAGLNGFPEALAVVSRHRNAGRRRRVSDTSSTGVSDAAKAGEPAYPWGPHSVRPRRRLAGGCAPSDPTSPTARHEPRTRRVGEDSRQRGGACRVARQGRAARLTLSDLARAGRPQNGGRLARYSAPGGGGSRGPRHGPGRPDDGS